MKSKKETNEFEELELYLPNLNTDNRDVNWAFRIALGDLIGNLCPHENPLLRKPKLAILAGLHYDRPWTRDSAINVWNGSSLIVPTVARDTLTSVLDNSKNNLRIGGQYWDSIIWVTGAWHHYLYTGDYQFLSLAYKAGINSIENLEATEFDPDDNLFRGPAVYGDGISAYPDIYTKTSDNNCCILSWPKANPDKVAKTGVGIPMKALSVNCLYYNAYVSICKMALALNIDYPPSYPEKAEKIKNAINKNFWMLDKNRYLYLKDPLGNCDHNEGLGHSFALLLGLADEKRADAIFENQFISPAGIPCLWPTFPRYQQEDENAIGRHSGTVWPPIQSFCANAAAKYGKTEIFSYEFFKLTEHAIRDGHFAELYHPFTEKMYGGLQEHLGSMECFISCKRQTSSATAYIRMVLMGLFGMHFDVHGLCFKPCVPTQFTKLTLTKLHYRRCELEISIEGSGNKIKESFLNGKPCKDVFIPADSTSKKHLRIVMA